MDNKLQIYKDFLPREIYEKRKKKIKEKNKNAIVALLLINIIFSFETVNKIIEAKENKNHKEVVVEYKADKKDSLYKFIELFRGMVAKGEIVNGEGRLEIEEVNVGLIEGKMQIKSIEIDEDKAYLEVKGD
ncbi:hypothetical protein [uncultured Clostridium sp.]|uniref:hypothetical protein n=1 Tax=uncultured Clostridium sp. TaxID=59620 RepID=UPI00260DC3A7|nr:hypothetical protein [uncultured Clostridium sp.]